jgi:hypothetical protein
LLKGRAGARSKQPQEETMRRFMVHLVTEVDFEDGDEASVKDARVENVSVLEIKAEL